jgi:hypothetical protein
MSGFAPTSKKEIRKVSINSCIHTDRLRWQHNILNQGKGLKDYSHQFTEPHCHKVCQDCYTMYCVDKSNIVLRVSALFHALSHTGYYPPRSQATGNAWMDKQPDSDLYLFPRLHKLKHKGYLMSCSGHNGLQRMIPSWYGVGEIVCVIDDRFCFCRNYVTAHK